jgi:hypothetical protein
MELAGDLETMSKRPDLSAALGGQVAPKVQRAAEPIPAPPPARAPGTIGRPRKLPEGYKSLSLRVNAEARKALRQMALDRDCSIHDLLVDALNQYFEAQGLPPMAIDPRYSRKA